MIPNSPATIANEIQDKLAALIDSRSSYFEASDPEICTIPDDLDRLGKADARLRSVLYAWYYVALGDRPQSDYYLRNSEQIHADPVMIGLARLTTLISLGYVSESLPVLRHMGRPEFGLQNLFLSRPPSTGAYHTHADIFERAKSMNLSNLSDHRPEFAAAAEIMDEWGDTDEDYTQALDIAGQIMRERKMFFKGNMTTSAVQIPWDGSPPYVKLTFAIDIDLDTAIDMTSEFGDRLSRSGKKIPSSMVFQFDSLAE